MGFPDVYKRIRVIWYFGQSMIYIAEAMTYVNLSAIGLLCILAAIHYFRLKHDQYLAIIVGGIVCFSGWVWGSIHSSTVSGIAYPPPITDLIAVSFWAFAFSWKDRPGKTRIGIIFAFFLVVSLVMRMFMCVTGEPFCFELLSGIFKIGIVLYALSYAFYAKSPGRHFFVQSFTFFLIAFLLRPALTFTPFIEDGRTAKAVLDIFHATANTFGYISMILFVDILTATRGSRRRRHEAIARVFEATPQITRQLKAYLNQETSRSDFSGGVEFVARAIEEAFGLSKIFIGRPEDDEHGLRLVNCPSNQHPNLISTSVSLPETIVSEVINTRQPLLVSDTSTDPRTMMDKTFERFEINSFIAVPFRADDATTIVMLVGEKIDGMPLDENDAALLDIVAGRVSEVFAAIVSSTEAEAASKMDAVTQLQNFSSFQKLLSEAIAEADKNSTAFALLLFDTDHFSTINEELGYESGDRILRSIGEQLSRHVDKDLTGRVGADEFACLLRNEEGDIREKVERILSEINEGLRDLYKENPLSISAAYSIYPYDFSDQTGVFGKMKEMLAAGSSASRRIVRVKVG